MIGRHIHARWDAGAIDPKRLERAANPRGSYVETEGIVSAVEGDIVTLTNGTTVHRSWIVKEPS